MLLVNVDLQCPIVVLIYRALKDVFCLDRLSYDGFHFHLAKLAYPLWYLFTVPKKFFSDASFPTRMGQRYPSQLSIYRAS